MPSARPCAAFEPISPDFDLAALVESTPNFEYVVRIHCDMIDHQGIENFEKLVLLHVILGGKPLIIEGYEERLDRWTFAVQWLRDNCAQKGQQPMSLFGAITDNLFLVENARDLTKKTNLPLTIGHYLNNMALLTNQWNPTNYKDPDRQRIYLKDIDCPQLWHDKLQDLVPLGLYYLNESTGEIGGPGAIDEADSSGPSIKKGRGIAKAGDLMSSLPSEMRAENMMCYIGHEGTYTPCHREMCASLGQNIMVETSTGLTEDGNPTRVGSSIWFMTESKEREVVSEYWLSTLGHDIEVENHFAQINAWRNAPFKTYVVEQRVGDFILIPPLAPHQVWNRGSRTVKVAWNRTTVETLEMALNEALPRARMVCRDEQYKNKAIVYFSLVKYSGLLKGAAKLKQKRHGSKQKDTVNAKIRQLEKDFRRLEVLFTQIMVSESFLPDQEEKKVEYVPYDSNITCSYCRCNIFNRFLTCPSCIGELSNGEEDTYDVCMECYAMGRSCACISKLRWVEQFPWGELVQKHEQWRHQIIAFEGQVTEKSPKSLKMELNRLGKKRTLAQICQVELAKRPWRDIKKPAPAVEGEDRDEEAEVDVIGNLKKKRKVRRSEKFRRDHKACHVDKSWEPKWKQAECTHCAYSFCYGTLFRGYDMMPQDVMADPDWRCPRCLNICGCRECRKRPGYTPFTPSGTLLGHDTKKIADPRSVESLVDFSYSNLSWIQKAGDDLPNETRRLKRHQKAADAAKARGDELGEHYVEEGDTPAEEDGVEAGILQLAQQEGIPIDPALGAANGNAHIETDSQDDEEFYNENPEEVNSGLAYGAQRPPASQYVVPLGGVLRDAEHAYNNTEAITYDYPDPETGVLVAIPLEPDQQMEQVPLRYEPAVPPDSPARIEMVNRKRKRPPLDDGDKPHDHKGSGGRNKKKGRKTLVVKFILDKTKLAEIDSMAVMAQHALASVPESKGPVISSDIGALNATWTDPEGQVNPKKARVEHTVEEVDDEFTPWKRRDRRRSAQNHEFEPSRRIPTRMQKVAYGEPSEEESQLENGYVRGTTQKVRFAVAVDGARDHMSISSDNGDEEEDDEMHIDSHKRRSSTVSQLRPSNGELSIRRFSDINEGDSLPAADEVLGMRDTDSLLQATPKDAEKPSKSAISSMPSKKFPATSKNKTVMSTTQSRSESVASNAKAMAQAEENRRAKLGILEAMNEENGSPRSTEPSVEQNGIKSSGGGLPFQPGARPVKSGQRLRGTSNAVETSQQIQKPAHPVPGRRSAAAD